MTAVETLTGASSNCFDKWDTIEWSRVEKQVFRLQVRIAKAVREKKFSKVKSLQWILTHSYFAKLLAVKRVCSNKGAKTPGVDGVIWNTKQRKIKTAKSLKSKGYKTSPLQRIYIPKANGKKRPLSIPVMKCRAMQALYRMALEPVTETLADHKSFGFRPRRSTADAIEHGFVCLCRKNSAQWVLEGDIHSCFDEINHEWLLANVPMHKGILRKWLKAGYVENSKRYPTEKGTPQGGIISPTLLVFTLSGLHAAIMEAVDKRDQVNLVVYADDFIVTGRTKEILEEKVKPAIKEFLKVRGLELSLDKTKTTHINDGFDFLGQNFRKYGDKLLITPSKTSVKKFLREIRTVIKKGRTAKQANLISQLNPKIRGWGNYYRHVCAKATYYKIDHQIFCALWKWAKRRHPNKKSKWVKKRYFERRGARDWVFSAKCRSPNTGEHYHFDLIHMGDIPIRRHLKIKGDANPYIQRDFTYFEWREKRKMNVRDGRTVF